MWLISQNKKWYFLDKAFGVNKIIQGSWWTGCKDEFSLLIGKMVSLLNHYGYTQLHLFIIFSENKLILWYNTKMDKRNAAT